MKIYGVFAGNDYEGGSLSHKLFKLKTDALLEANALAVKWNEERNMEYKITYSGDEWRDKDEYIKVMECKLI